MQINVKGTWIKKLVADKKLREEFAELVTWRSDESFVNMTVGKMTDDEVHALIDYLTSLKAEKTKGTIQKLNSWLRLKAKPDGVPLHKLEQLAAAVKTYMKDAPHKWLFYTSEADGAALPYYVSEVTYTPGSRDRGPANTCIRLAYSWRGGNETTTATFHSDDMTGRTVVQMLNDRGYYLETPAMVEEYRSTLERYRSIADKTGCQFQAYGIGKASTGRYGLEWLAMERDGQPSKVVMDDLSEDNASERSRRGAVVSSAFWRADDEVISTDEDDGVVDVPLHPYVKVFNLQTHQFVSIHVSYLVEYEYDQQVIHKLILPDDRKQLIGMLVAGSSQLMEDIVKGKTGGVIVITVGPPGTGKTLTAQVFSEQIKRPLYEVQCSQLGTDEEALEKQLSSVLTRATRWNAILLIDEADVYIHERGDDIHQNAIVGVFLRVLETYRGVLFMTSNRGTIIDDAILSRATAYIEYTYPTQSALERIWRVLAENYLVEFTDAEIAQLVERFKGISGRRVKALLKLARLAAMHRNERVSVELVVYVEQFLPKDGSRPQEGNNHSPAQKELQTAVGRRA